MEDDLRQAILDMSLERELASEYYNVKAPATLEYLNADGTLVMPPSLRREGRPGLVEKDIPPPRELFGIKEPMSIRDESERLVKALLPSEAKFSRPSEREWADRPDPTQQYIGTREMPTVGLQPLNVNRVYEVGRVPNPEAVLFPPTPDRQETETVRLPERTFGSILEGYGAAPESSYGIDEAPRFPKHAERFQIDRLLEGQQIWTRGGEREGMPKWEYGAEPIAYPRGKTDEHVYLSQTRDPMGTYAGTDRVAPALAHRGRLVQTYEPRVPGPTELGLGGPKVEPNLPFGQDRARENEGVAIIMPRTTGLDGGQYTFDHLTAQAVAIFNEIANADVRAIDDARPLQFETQYGTLTNNPFSLLSKA